MWFSSVPLCLTSGDIHDRISSNIPILHGYLKPWQRQFVCSFYPIHPSSTYKVCVFLFSQPYPAWSTSPDFGFLHAWCVQSITDSALASALLMYTVVYFLQAWFVSSSSPWNFFHICLQTPHFKTINLLPFFLFHCPWLTSIHCKWKYQIIYQPPLGLFCHIFVNPGIAVLSSTFSTHFNFQIQ